MSLTFYFECQTLFNYSQFFDVLDLLFWMSNSFQLHPILRRTEIFFQCQTLFNYIQFFDVLNFFFNVKLFSITSNSSTYWPFIFNVKLFSITSNSSTYWPFICNIKPSEFHSLCICSETADLRSVIYDVRLQVEKIYWGRCRKFKTILISKRCGVFSI